jgi:hypothetical protein
MSEQATEATTVETENKKQISVLGFHPLALPLGLKWLTCDLDLTSVL